MMFESKELHSGRALAVFCLLLLLLPACSSCSSNGSATPDGGTGSDTDTDVDTDTDADTDTGPYVTDAGQWEWQDNPDAGEDCGPGCEQVTFTDDVRAIEWDVWGKKIAFRGDYRRVYVSDTENGTTLIVPQVHEDHPISGGENGAFWPAIFEETLIYEISINTLNPGKSELVLCDFAATIQKVIASHDKPPLEEGVLAKVNCTDIMNDHLISTAGCDDPDYYNVCYFTEPFIGNGTSLLDGNDNGFNAFTTIWENKIVFLDVTQNPLHNVRGYDLNTEQFFDVTDDNYYQNTPRIGSNKVVWQDFRFSAYAPWEKHSNTVIFVKDLITDVTTQLTDGSAISTTPDVFGDIAVWLDWRHCADPQGDVYMDFECAEIYGRNLSTGVEARITNIPDRSKDNPRIWGDKIFARMKTEAGSAIFMFDIPPALL